MRPHALGPKNALKMGMGLGEMGCCGARKPDAAGLKDFKVQLAARKRVELVGRR